MGIEDFIYYSLFIAAAIIISGCGSVLNRKIDVWYHCKRNKGAAHFKKCLLQSMVILIMILLFVIMLFVVEFIL